MYKQNDDKNRSESYPLKENFVFFIRREILVCLFLLLSTLAVYWQIRKYEFVSYDDTFYVTNNSFVRSGLSSESLIWALTTGHASNWHPVTWLSHILDVELYGMNPGSHHLTNLLFHIANTLLLFFVLKQMTGVLWQSSFVAALFALHPLHVESVAWVSERKDVLSTFFWMLTILSYIRYLKYHTLAGYLLTLLFFILGLMAKPMLVTLPFVLLLLDYWILNNIKKTEYHHQTIKTDSYISHFSLLTSHFSLLIEKIPFFIFAGASSIITFFVQKNWGAVSSLDACSFHLRASNAFISYISYIGKMFMPYRLAILYPFPDTIPLWKTAGAFLLIISISFIVIRNMRKHPYLIVGWLWYMGTLVPVIGLVQVGIQSMADRYTYIPLIGLFIIIAWGVSEFINKIYNHSLKLLKTPITSIRIKIWLAVLSAGLLSVFMAVTWLQTRYWKDSTVLFEHALSVTTDNKLAHYGLGDVLLSQGRFDEAVQALC